MTDTAASERPDGAAIDVRQLTILPGHDKLGAPESYHEIVLTRGDLVALVGPTGSGKSRLLADIEWLATGDSPSGRRVLVNQSEIKGLTRYRLGAHLVAQLSQTMTFMVDLDVGQFLALHAESRGLDRNALVVTTALHVANELAGEAFTAGARLSNLSGGQSRALMIADTALLCASPVVLIDEIENAGIDRRQALATLLSNDKIVIVATHDPLLALLAPRRLVIRNGAIAAVLERTEEESRTLADLERLDLHLQSLRAALRGGQTLPSRPLANVQPIAPLQS